MWPQELVHGEHGHRVLTKQRLQRRVAVDRALVRFALQVVLLDVYPQPLHNLVVQGPPGRRVEPQPTTAVQAILQRRCRTSVRGRAFSPPQKSDISFDSVCALERPPEAFLPDFFFVAALRGFLALDAEPLPAPLDATLLAFRFLLVVLAIGTVHTTATNTACGQRARDRARQRNVAQDSLSSASSPSAQPMPP